MENKGKLITEGQSENQIFILNLPLRVLALKPPKCEGITIDITKLVMQKRKQIPIWDDYHDYIQHISKIENTGNILNRNETSDLE